MHFLGTNSVFSVMHHYWTILVSLHLVLMKVETSPLCPQAAILIKCCSKWITICTFGKNVIVVRVKCFNLCSVMIQVAEVGGLHVVRHGERCSEKSRSATAAAAPRAVRSAPKAK